MANTTFNGPVRSENGFQEWDGTAWVPVAGGGGSAIVIPYVAGNQTYTMDAFTEVGETRTYVWEFHLPAAGDASSIEVATTPGYIASTLLGNLYPAGTGISPGPTATIVAVDEGVATYTLTATLTGYYVEGETSSPVISLSADLVSLPG